MLVKSDSSESKGLTTTTKWWIAIVAVSALAWFLTRNESSAYKNYYKGPL